MQLRKYVVPYCARGGMITISGHFACSNIISRVLSATSEITQAAVQPPSRLDLSSRDCSGMDTISAHIACSHSQRGWRQ